jgi:sugar lactone lactonase YvrE
MNTTVWKTRPVVLGLAGLLASATPVLANKDQIGYTQLRLEYPLLPAGSNLTVLQAESALDWTNFNWAVAPTGEQANRRVTYLPADANPTAFSSHANGVAADLVGSTTSIIPQVPLLISCQDSYYIDSSLNTGQTAAPLAPTWDLENHSWAWSDGTWSSEITRRIDWRVDQQGVTIVVCLANGTNTTVPYVLASAYNVIAVGRSDGGHSRGGTMIEGSGRCKPDVVAPEAWTSNATPVVASCAGLLIDQTKADSQFATARDPRVIKALLMAGATKEESFAWTHSPTQPLDAVFGAGQVNIGNSYRMLMNGRQPAGNTWAAASGWDKGTSGSGKYFLEVPAGQVATVSAVLTWHRTITPGNNWSAITPTVADLNLRLSNAGPAFDVNTLVSESRSPIDNVEHIYETNLPAGRYVLEVTGPAGVTYGIAWRSELFDLEAPLVSLPPASQAVTVGSNATLSASVSGFPAPSFQWRKDGVVLTDGNGIFGATSPTLTIVGVQVADAGVYILAATNSVGSATSTSAVLTVNKATPLITWPAPAEMMTGAALSPAQLDATASVHGTFVYAPAAGTVMDAGTQALSVTFTPTDTENYSTATATQTLLVDVVPAAPNANAAGDVIANRFGATWSAVAGAASYRIDVSTDSAFSTFLPGYEGLDLGDVTSANVSGLNPGTTYYYRIQAFDRTGAGLSSNTVAVSTPLTASISLPLSVGTFAGHALSSGSVNGTGKTARFNYPAAVAADAAGNLYLADTDNHTLRRVDTTGVVTSIAGAAGTPGAADGAGSAARFNEPSGVVVDVTGDIYIADTLNHTLRKVTAAGVVTTFAGTAGASGNTDGTGLAARFFGPQGLAIDGAGNLFVADTNNDTIRKVVLKTGEVRTIAGAAGTAGSADGTGTGAQFNHPAGVAVDASGNLYVADTDNHVVRTIAPSGAVSTLAGRAGASGAADGIGSAATFDSPSAIAVDSSGSLYVADTGNFTVRMIVPATRATSTLAGLAGTSGSADGVGSGARFFQPAGIALDPYANVYIADTNNHTIRSGYFAAAPVIQTQPQSQTVTLGNAVQFSVTATGRPAPTYQWYHDGVVIGGATLSTYNGGNAASTDAGSYTVVVTNASGSVTSSAATLTVNPVVTPPLVKDTGGSGGGGGGAPSLWFCGALVLFVAARTFRRRKE